MDPKEYQIWQLGKKQGKDDAFIKGAILAYRSSKAQPSQPTTLEDKLRTGNYGSQVGAEQVAGVNKIKTSISKGAEDINKGMGAISDGSPRTFMGALSGFGNLIKGTAESAFGTISGAARTAFAPFTPAIEKVAPTVVPAAINTIPGVGLIPQETKQQIVDYVANKYKDVSTKYPDATVLTGDILNTVLLALGGEANIGKGMLSKEGFNAARTGLLQDVKSIPSTIKSVFTPKPANVENTITEMISPKATLKEARLAQTEGRLVERQKPTLFKAGTEDVITPSAKTKSATQTIIKEIPNAEKMSPTELYKAVDTKITETATKLRPQMEATPIKPQTIDKLNTDWQSLKKQQIADAPATEEINVAKRQGKFEAILQKSGNTSHADLWDTRITYDESIPANVKKANSVSSESLQLQREEWLQNRQILNDAIDASAEPEFKTMSDLYNAKSGILSQTKLEGALPSKFTQWTKDNPKKWLTIRAVLGVEGLRLLGIDPLKLIP